MGYSVMMLDTDSFFFQDPYSYVKRPPFANISYMSMADGGNTVNGGASYIHNFQPGGPAAHTIASMVRAPMAAWLALLLGVTVICMT